jgi:integrase/recombinase XerD
VKNGIAKDVMLPERLGRILDRYVDEIRPKLLNGRDSRRVWISETGGDLTPEAIHDQIKKVTLRFCGKTVGPHLFRHCAATSIAEDTPELAYIIQFALGHSTSVTSDLYYNRAKAVEASRRLHSAIALISQGE